MAAGPKINRSGNEGIMKNLKTPILAIARLLAAAPVADPAFAAGGGPGAGGAGADAANDLGTA
jgi:hypothetical protein